MGLAFSAFVQIARRHVAAILGIGGGGGTSIITAGMRELPLRRAQDHGLDPCLRRCRAFVDVSDIIMMPSVTDMAGLNRLSRIMLHNAAAGDRRHGAASGAGGDRQAIDRADHVRRHHALRDGDRRRGCARLMTAWCSMPPAPAAGRWRSLPTAACSPASSTSPRPKSATFCSAACCRRPRIGSAPSPAPACPMSARSARSTWSISGRRRHGARSTIARRQFYEHNPNVTLMRTTAEECRAIGEWIGARLNRCDGPVRFLIPEKGVSALDIEGGAVLRSASRCRAVRGHRGDAAANARPPPHPLAAAHQRPRIRRGRGRRVPRNRQRVRSTSMPAIRAQENPRKIQGHDRRRRADRRRRRRHRPVGQGRGSGRHRSDHHLQFRPLPHGRPRLGRRPARLWQRQRDRQGNGRGSAAGGQAHAGAGRRQRHRPFRHRCRSSSPN